MAAKREAEKHEMKMKGKMPMKGMPPKGKMPMKGMAPPFGRKGK